MLSGIKVGKKKNKRQRVDGSSGGSTSNAAAGPSNSNAAEALRAQLFSGTAAPSSATRQQQLPYEALQQKGRIGSSSENQSEKDVVVLTGRAASSENKPEFLQKEDYRFGARKGKVKRKAVDTIGSTSEEANMSIKDMLKAEKEQTATMDEVYARNVARMGSRFKGTELKGGSATGADEEDFVDVKVYQQQSLTSHAVAQRDRSRQLAHHDLQSRMAQKCWWWMESPSFSKHMLIALGNHVSLVMAPSNLSLFSGHQFYLVPLQHADSLVQCDDNVWNEIARFQQSLRKLYAKENQDVIFMESVLNSGSKGFWQSRLVGIPVPRKKNDAPMYFKQAMLEQAEEWGTHNKVMSTKGKGLRGTVPKNKFNYFYVEWGTNDGFAQIIESDSKSFPKDFGVDTVAGMLQMDPIRFQRRNKRQSHQEEKQMVLDFLKNYKTVDWTLELEG